MPAPYRSVASIAFAALLFLFAGHAVAQPEDQVEALIDKLREIARGDVGYSATMTGSSFLPLDTFQPGSMLLFQRPPFKGHLAAVRALAFAPDGKRFRFSIEARVQPHIKIGED
jgi:hypothetical protein